MYSRQAPYTADNNKVERLNSLLVDLVCKEGLLLRVVESSAFKAFVNELDPRYKVPTRQALSSTLIPMKYDAVKADLAEKMS